MAVFAALAFSVASPAAMARKVAGSANLATQDSPATQAGDRAHPSKRPAGKPAHATAHCRDGSDSFRKRHQALCSRHGGVAQWHR
ncbi:DUF3761 domain-containing protein [Chromobacterium sp. IIBBL 290-4]|uniref:DUF3761 domain-containing protein n=1 Tax=Chromobacterium sp. IIBBL 290-4 TaxID=2953890 RepID=UPI003531D0A8